MLAIIASCGQVVVPIAVQQTLDRGLNGLDGPDVSFVAWMGVVCAVAIVADQLGVLPHDQPAVRHLRARPGHPAHQGLPARPRPAAAHPEHRAPRCPGLAGHHRRRPGQPVPGLRRPDLHREHRPDDGGHGHHGDLQLAAGAGRLGGVRAAVPVDPLLPAQALRCLQPGPPAGGRAALRDLRAGGRRGGRPVLRRRAADPEAHRRRHRRVQGGEHPRPDVHRDLLQPGRHLGGAGQRRASSSSACCSASPAG